MKFDPVTLGIAAIAIIAAIMLASMFGCAAKNDYAACQQSVVATDATVVTTHDLLTAGTISKGDVQPILVSANTLASAEASWKAALDANDTNAVTTATTAATAALSTLQQQLSTLQKTKNLPLNASAGRQRLSLKALGAGRSTGDKKTVGELAAAIEIIQLVSDLNPLIVSWINAATASSSVTSADVQTALDTLNRDIASLTAAAQ